MDEIELLRRKHQRELKARIQAESILESKSLELHEAKLSAETALKELDCHKTEIEAIVDCAAEGIISLDHELRVRKFNRAAAQIFELSPENALGIEFDSLFEDLPREDIQGFLESHELRRAPKEYRIGGGDAVGIVEVTLSKMNDELQNAIIAIVRDRTNSKRLESQLALAQKMESIGLLAAGIAHEINSPMQYVSDNTRLLQTAFSDIENLLESYGNLVDAITDKKETEKLIGEIAIARGDADLEFLLEEVPDAIDQTLAGAERVNSIVGAMKVFSHPGQKQMGKFDLNKSIDSTVTVTKNEWKYSASIRKILEPNLSFCFGDQGKLNQVLLNLIVNAAHAINKRYEQDPHMEGIIQIETRNAGEFIELSIQDNGCGIPQEELPQIFDPFFTTKPVGKGTGQGLAITHSIVVEVHGGSIEVESVLDVGTRFILKLPTEPSSSNLTENSKDE